MVFREVGVTVFTCETRFFKKIYGLVWLSYESNIPDKKCFNWVSWEWSLQFLLTFVTGKKRGATVRLSNVTINAPSVLKHEEELESLAVIMPADSDARRKWVVIYS